MVLELVIVAIVILLAAWFARSYPKRTRSGLETILALRVLIVGFFLLVFAIVLIFTGIFWLILLGAALLFLIVLFVVTVREGGDLRSATEVMREWI